MILPDFELMNADPALALYQPHLSLLVSENMPHKLAHDLLQASFTKSSEKEAFSKIWSDFVAPWFGLPSSWEDSDGLDQTGEHSVFAVGQKVRTAVGDGQIVSIVKSPGAFRYLIQFDFGAGYVRPSAVAHLLPGTEAEAGAADADTSKLMSDDLQVLFGTEAIYIFVRRYILLVTMLYQAKGILEKKSADADKMDEGEDKSASSLIMASLQELVRGKIEAKDFEVECRKHVESEVYNFVAIPPLLEKCAEALVEVAKEDCLENLYHCSQLKLKDLNQLRSLSLEVTEDAVYRLQIQSSASQVFFSYLPTEVELQLTSPLDDKQAEPAEPEKPAESDAKPPAESDPKPDAKRPLETEEPAGSKESSAAEPEQKRMKTGDDAPMTTEGDKPPERIRNLPSPRRRLTSTLAAASSTRFAVAHPPPKLA